MYSDGRLIAVGDKEKENLSAPDQTKNLHIT